MDGKLLVTNSVKLLFSVLIMFHIFFRLLMPGSRVLNAQLSLTFFGKGFKLLKE